jgi:hypothetical protein
MNTLQLSEIPVSTKCTTASQRSAFVRFVYSHSYYSTNMCLSIVTVLTKGLRRRVSPAFTEYARLLRTAASQLYTV